MQHVLALLTALAGLAAATPAQSYSFSPPGADTTEGNYSDLFPHWVKTARYMQIHPDLRGAKNAGYFKELAFRRSFDKRTIVTGRQRWVDVEIRVGDGDVTRHSLTFSRNFVGSPTTVLPRTRANLPDLRVHPGPNKLPPFNVNLPFKTQWLHRGVKDFVWDLKHHDAELQGQRYPLDGWKHYAETDVVRYGTACWTGGHFRSVGTWLRAGSRAFDRTYAFRLGTAGCVQGVLRTFGGVAISPVRTDTAVGWCTNLYVNLAASTLLLGRTNSSGFVEFTGGRRVVVPWQSTLANLRVYMQSFCDDRRSPAGVALGDGTQVTVAPLPKTPAVVRRVFSWLPNAQTGRDDRDAVGDEPPGPQSTIVRLRR